MLRTLVDEVFTENIITKVIMNLGSPSIDKICGNLRAVGHRLDTNYV